MSSKKSIKCSKCKQTFTSEYLLQKHINKKIPCDQILQCDKCKKQFKQHHHLEQHLNRKTPCVKISTIENELMIIKAKEESALKIINAKKEAKLEIEKEKTKRKATKTIITNNTQINNNFYIPPPIINTFDCNLQNTINHFNDNIKKIDSLDVQLSRCDKFENVFVMILKLFYNNSEFPEYKNVIYTPSEEKFYSIINMQWIEQPFDNLYPIFFKSIIKTMYEFGYKGIENVDGDNISNHYPKMIGYYRTYSTKVTKRKETDNKKEIKEYAEEALEIKENELQNMT